jgi:hypothetical protein
MSNGKSLNKLLADCIINSGRTELVETLLDEDETKRAVVLSQAEFTVEERERLLKIKAATIEGFYAQALEALGLVTKESQSKGIEREV